MANRNKKIPNANSQRNEVFLDFIVPSDIPTHYINEMSVQDFQTEFILSFFEVRTPIVLPDNVGSIKAHCVARVAVSVERIPEFIKALDSRFKAFMERRKSLIGDTKGTE